MAKGTMDRIADILKSNVNEALNRIEDPVKMVDQITRDVEEEVDKAVAALASAMATQRRLEREVQRNDEQIQIWLAKAKGAVEAGDEDYARLVLAQKARLEQTNDRLEPVLAESGEKAAQLRVQVEELRGKLQEVRARREKLVARYRAERRSGQASPAGVADEVEAVARFAAAEQRVRGHERDFARFEQQSEQLVAEAEFQRELDADRQVEQELNQAERDRQVEQELAELKLGKGS